MADSQKPNTPQGAAPPTPAATPSLQGVTKPGQGQVPVTPGGPTTPAAATAANIASASAAGDAAANKQVEKTELSGEPQPSGPAIHGGQITVRRKELEARLKSLQEEDSRHNARARATTAAMLSELKDIEARTKGGLNELTPVGNLLHVDGSIIEQYPDDHLRWVNETQPGRAAFLASRGYTRVPGQIAGGDMVLWKIPRSKWAENFTVKEAQTERGLRKATSQNRDDTVQELQTFFDKHGVKIDANDLILKERA